MVFVKKPANLRWKLLFLGLYALLLLMWILLRLPCIFRTVTGIPCPTCGLTRAWLSALQMDFTGAIRQYPMFWSIPVLILFLIFDGEVFPSRKVNLWIIATLVLGIFLIYFARLLGFLGILLPL